MKKNSRQIQRRYSPKRILAITILGIALAEVAAMIVVYYVHSGSYFAQVILDATIMTVIIYPLLYYLSFRPLFLNIREQDRSESISQTRLRLMQFSSSHTVDELLQFILDEIELLTGSTIGFYHFLDTDQKTIKLHTWSTNTLQNMCKAGGARSHYSVDQAGVWADAIRQRKAVIHNDYSSLPDRKGTPEGHAQVIREMVVPVMRDQNVLAILGVGNKPQAYSDDDVKLVSTLADFAWDIIQNRKAEEELRYSEEKFRTLANWTNDWEKWLDPQGNIVYTSPSCERITGYTPEEFMADSHLLERIVHPDDQQLFRNHLDKAHNGSAEPITIEYRVVSRDGSEHWIEHICRPLFGPDNTYLGRRVNNREITLRKQADKRISEQNKKEIFLTQKIQSIQTDIARDLHDTLGQNISYLRMNLEQLLERHSDELKDHARQIHNMTKAANESYELIRAMLTVLQSGNSNDPIDLFDRYLKQIAERSSFKSVLTSKGDPTPLTPYQIRQLFYIFREALSNIEKYANANRVAGKFIWEEQALTMEISDNGQGFDPDIVNSNGHYGLQFMRDRAERLKGSFSIRTAPTKGTRLTVRVPYESESSDYNPAIQMN